MPVCPACATPLNTVRQRDGIFFHCPGCDGRAISFPQIRRMAGDRFATELIRQLNRFAQSGGKPCPFCRQPMRVFPGPQSGPALDACRLCTTVWFDPREFEAVPEGAVESSDELHMRAAEAHARLRLWEAEPQGVSDAPPEDLWKVIPGLFGCPVETQAPTLRGWPWLTWLVAGLITVISLIAFTELEDAVRVWGFVPAQAWRYGGLTWVSSFFIHGGLLHLIGNLYFLLVFGDNVEDVLGRHRYGLLLVAATLAGNLVHWLAMPSSTVPCVGASGGISGVIAFYGLKFPQARLGFLFRYFVHFRWVQMPAWTALVLWLVWQIVGLSLELSGFSSVAATAHLGGAAVGFVAWLRWRQTAMPEISA